VKDYYQILGVAEEASGEEIEARWAELMKEYHPRLHEREGETAEKIKEIREAYEVLRDPSSRREYNFGRILKRLILEGKHQRRKERYDRGKRLIIPAAIVLLFLIGGFFIIKIALTPQQKPIVPVALAPVPEAEGVASISKSVPGEMPKVHDEKSSQTIAEQMAKSQETISSVAKLPRKKLEHKEKIAKEPVKTEKIIPGEMPKPEVSKSLKPMLEERPKVEEPKPVRTEPRPAKAYVPAPEKTEKPGVTTVTAKETPKVAPGREPKKVSRTLPKEEPKTTPQEPPASQPSRPEEAKPMDQKSQVAQIPPAKSAAPIAAVPSMPHPFTKENEVREFLAKYVDRYTQRDIEGFLSFFSPMAIQNQKDGIEQIRKIYSRQFELYERLKYQLKDPKIEILEKSVKVRASYEIEQFSKKGEMKQLRGDIDWDLVKEGGELKILAIQYRTHKTR
jgi:curved DNA-binding protein CbpA